MSKEIEIGGCIEVPDEIKSASLNPALAGFHRVAISSTIGGFN